MNTDKVKPDWLKVKYNADAVGMTAEVMKELGLNTVCREANCPNLGECFAKHTATFMILGNRCTRNCRFCNVTHGRPENVDPEEPLRIAEAVKELGLKHAVVTSVTRDDLPDGGAGHFAEVIRQIKKISNATVEVLIPDFKGDREAVDTVIREDPDVLNHNVETVRCLYSTVRPVAVYERSLDLLKYCKSAYPSVYVKTGFMVGLGETDEQITELIFDIKSTGCDILTIGQYLRPSDKHVPLDRYVSPDEFELYKKIALEAGITSVVSAPLARSSYLAFESLRETKRSAAKYESMSPAEEN